MGQLGDLVRAARDQQGISQRSLAIRARTSQAAVSRIETGAEEPSFERFERLMCVMGWKPELELVPLAEHGMSEAEMRRQAKMTHQARLDEALLMFRRARVERRGRSD